MPRLDDLSAADAVKWSSPRRAAKQAKQRISLLADQGRRRTYVPFNFNFSDKKDECHEQVAEVLHNISIGDFNKELEASSQETLISDDEKENIETGDDIAANLTSDTFSLDESTHIPGVDVVKINPESPAQIIKPISPINAPATPASPLPIDAPIDVLETPKTPSFSPEKASSSKNTPLENRILSPISVSDASSANYLKGTKASAMRAAVPRNTPTTEHRKTMLKPTPKKFDLKESLKKKPSWNMHTGKLKSVGQTYTPEAKKNIARVSKIQKARDDARTGQKSRASISRSVRLDKGRKGLGKKTK